MNVGHAASYLGVSQASLRNWSDQGKVPVYRTPGGQRRYLREDLEQVMHSWREQPAAPVLTTVGS
jgi:excisionase family DNA binding protein